MKTILSALLLISAIACSSDRSKDYLGPVEKQEEDIQREENWRTGKSDEMGPGYDYGTTSSPN